MPGEGEGQQKQGGAGDPGQQQQQQNNPPAKSWEDWLAGQPKDVQDLYAGHVTGLQNTIKATRAERDDNAKQLREMAKKAEAGSETQKSLEDMAGKLEMAERRAAFYEEAGRPEIGCRNPKAAFLLATADNLFDRKGNPDWAALKQAAPELFGTSSGRGNAGSGAGDGGGAGKAGDAGATMNDFIRRSSGRR